MLLPNDTDLIVTIAELNPLVPNLVGSCDISDKCIVALVVVPGKKSSDVSLGRLREGGWIPSCELSVTSFA